MDTEYTVIRYSNKYRKAVSTLYFESYGRKKPLSYFDYRLNSFGSPIAFLMKFRNKLVGFYAVVPIKIKIKALFRGILNRNEAAAPVQAPVTGKGIATKIINAHSPYFWYFFSNFLTTLLNHQLKNRSKILKCLLSQPDKGFKNQTINIAGIASPKTDITKANHGAI